jgi:hypothetical protein
MLPLRKRFTNWQSNRISGRKRHCKRATLFGFTGRIMKPKGTLLLSKSDIKQLLTFDECLERVENAFRLYANGQSIPCGSPGDVPIEAENMR